MPPSCQDGNRAAWHHTVTRRLARVARRRSPPGYPSRPQPV